MIWKNVFYNLTVILWQKFVWSFNPKYRKSKWKNYYKPYFKFWTKKQKRKQTVISGRAVTEYFKDR